MRAELFPKVTGVKEKSVRLGFLALGWLIIYPALSPAQSAIPTATRLNQIEETIWTAEGEALDNVEGDAARIIQLTPHSAHGHFLLAQLYLKQFRQNPSQLRLLKQASELGQQAMELNPELDYGYVVASQVLDIMGYNENSLGILEGDEKIKLQPSWRTDFVKAQLLSAQKSDGDAIVKFQSSLLAKDSLPNVIVPQYILALKAKYKGSDLEHQLVLANKQHEHRLFDFHRAIALSEIGQYQAAHQIYQELEKRYPDFKDALAFDAILLYSHLGQAKQATSIFETLLKSEMSSPARSLVHAHLATVLLEDQKQALASQKHFSDAIAESPNPMEWLAFSHKAYEKKNRLKDFIGLIQEVRLKIPPSSFLYALQGEVQSENLAQHEQAIESFRSAITLDPERSEFYNGLGLAYYRMTNYAEALKIFLEAIRIDPQDATSRYNQACVLAILGRSDEAIGSLREAIGLDPRLQQTARNDKDFEVLKSNQGFRVLTEPRSSAAAAIQP